MLREKTLTPMMFLMLQVLELALHLWQLQLLLRREPLASAVPAALVRLTHSLSQILARKDVPWSSMNLPMRITTGMGHCPRAGSMTKDITQSLGGGATTLIALWMRPSS